MGFRNEFVIIVSMFMVITVCVDQSINEDTPVGRIKSLDDMLMMYGKEITEGGNLKPAIEEAKKLAEDEDVNKEYAEYYIEILELIQESNNPKIIAMERDRLNGIITSASYQSDGQVEVNYAVIRRNILESFVDSSAQYLMDLVQSSPDLAMKRLKEMMKDGNVLGDFDNGLGDFDNYDDDDDDEWNTRILEDL